MDVRLKTSPPTLSPLRAGALCIALLALAACGTGRGAECTLLGSSPGVRVDVKAPDASRVASASLRVCWNGVCHEPEIELRTSTTMVPMDCDGDEPDAACGASASPDGGKTGFALVEGLPKTPVRVTLTLSDAQGRTVVEESVDATPKATFPNGRDCGEGPPQAELTVAGRTVTAG